MEWFLRGVLTSLVLMGLPHREQNISSFPLHVDRKANDIHHENVLTSTVRLVILGSWVGEDPVAGKGLVFGKDVPCEPAGVAFAANTVPAQGLARFGQRQSAFQAQ